ncbi:hypothetical protein M595_1384 [Lyngbya aestuarii BL J]|jgi:hypothetical protein|uniref:Uncharacterized protein n=1 Tax=Lyngbya aestuarii BL J TaxID=1348334 RepID=U7QKZ8_9CYAN|nr:hypothetical protein [Lyngbya aestuarii]ERT08639.1 hypothetical protein M595_1384 [Lyngbya aestuarii BL J]
MEHEIDFESEPFKSQLESLSLTIRDLSQEVQGNTVALLAILRTLELLHREIREGWFRDALPDNRQALYALLKEIETYGGWPYIPRASLRSLSEKLSAEPEDPPSSNQ